MNRILTSLLLVMIVLNVCAEGDPDAGKNASIICAGCHGEDGNSAGSYYPNLAGQGQNYLIKQLKDFKAGKRKERHMDSMVEAISMQDIPDLAAWFASQRVKSKPGSQENKLGKEIFYNGIASKNVTACADCHGEQAQGNDVIGFPNLAGQHRGYIVNQLKNFRSGTRTNDNMLMQGTVKLLSDKEVESLAIYLESL